MKGIPIGIVGFLGIFAPGALLVTNGILIWYLFDPRIIGDALAVNDFGKGSLTFILALLSFTVGMCLRMVPPRCAEAFRAIWSAKEAGKPRSGSGEAENPVEWDEMPGNGFAESLMRYTAVETMGWWKDALGHVPAALWTIHMGPWICHIPKKATDPKSLKGWRRLRLFNYAKRAILHESDSLGREVLLAESHVRFVSGVVWSLAFGGLAGILGVVCAALWKVTARTGWMGLVALAVVNLAMFVVAAMRVGEMRRHEAELVMQSFLVVEGARRSRAKAAPSPHQSP
jgi:hypothetical protein